MNFANHVVDAAGLIFGLLVGGWATAFAYGLLGDRLIGRWRWKPETRAYLRWLGPLLVVLCVAAFVLSILPR
jgi:hypothetical protein